MRAEASDGGSAPALPFVPICPPDGPLVATQGPYVVFSEWDEGDRSSVFVHDVGLNKYWIALDRIQLTEVLVAGAQLIVWTGNQILRIGLHGYTERVLFAHPEIKELRLSPDQSRLAISYGQPLNLVVIQIESGKELLTVEADDQRLQRLRQVRPGSDDDSSRVLTLGEWSERGDELSLRAHRYSWPDGYVGLPEQLAILSLEDELSVLPAGWLLSPDLRYGLNPGEPLGAERFFPSDRYLWREFDVVDMDNGALLWTVVVERGQGIIPSDPSIWGRWRALERVIWGSDPERLVYFEYGDRLPAHVYQDLAEAAGSAWRDWYRGRADSEVIARVLDLESGTIRDLSHEEWIEAEEADALAAPRCLYSRRGYHCLLSVEDEIIWEGRPRLIGVIEPEWPLVWPGLVLREQERISIVSSSRPSGEVRGPLIAYTLETIERGPVGQSGAQWHRRSRVMVHDAGSSQTWLAFAWRVPLGERIPVSLRLARGGFVLIDGDVVRFADLRGVTQSILFEETLRERESIANVRVSPGGRYVAIRLYRDETPDGYVHPGEGYSPASYTVIVVEIESGRTIARVAFELEYTGAEVGSLYTMSWNESGTALGVTEYGYPDVHWAGTLYPETGEFRRPPSQWFSPAHISPDLRYALRVWMVNRATYSDGPVRYEDRNEPAQLHVLDYLTEEVVWRSQVLEASPDPNERGWHAPEQLAWIEGGERTYFDRDGRRFRSVPEEAVVTLANVTTGEVEVMDGAEYLAWLASTEPREEAGAVVECPRDRERLCRVLLDGVVIGEGRWLRVSGEIPLD